MSSYTQQTSRLTVRSLQTMKKDGDKIACLTAYDASFAQVLDRAGVDVVLVGDSLGMVVQGRQTTLPVTIDDMLYHGSAVSRGLDRALLMIDMPFLSYTTPQQALENAGQLMQRANAQMVKLEGGAEQAGIVSRLAQHGIPVCAHLGLKPQSVHKLGGFRVQGRDPDRARELLEAGKQLQNAGADIILLECVPNELGQAMTAQLDVPVIGIGAGPHVDGQILVLYDVLGITMGRTPRFVQNFQQGHDSPLAALQAYVQAVKDGSYPGPEHCFS